MDRGLLSSLPRRSLIVDRLLSSLTESIFSANELFQNPWRHETHVPKSILQDAASQASLENCVEESDPDFPPRLELGNYWFMMYDVATWCYSLYSQLRAMCIVLRRDVMVRQSRWQKDATGKQLWILSFRNSIVSVTKKWTEISDVRLNNRSFPQSVALMFWFTP